MASSPAPATPASQTTTVTASSTPGNWSHPRMREITLRRKAATFDDENASALTFAVVALTASFVLPFYFPVSSLLQALFSSSVSTTLLLGGNYLLWLIRAVCFIHGFNATRPLWTKDDLKDIPLTPNQRQLLGLKAVPTTPAPGDVQTPPRYTRSGGTPASSRAATVGSSPFARSISGGYSVSGVVPGSPASSIGSIGKGASPLMRQAIRSGSGKKWSLGTSSAFDESIFGNGGPALPPTPSPIGVQQSPGSGQRAVSVGLNSKWLYKRQHGGSPGSGNYI